MKHTVQIEFPRQGVWRRADRLGGGRKAILVKNEYAVRERCEMNKNVHMPGAASERRGGGLEQKDAGESPGRIRTHFRFYQRPVYTQFKPYYHQQKPSKTGHVNTADDET